MYWDQLDVVVPAGTPTYSAEEESFEPRSAASSGVVASAMPMTATYVLEFVRSGGATALLIDPQGRRSGTDSTGAVYSEVPGVMTVDYPATTNDEDGGSEALPAGFGQSIAAAGAGGYTLKVSAATAESVYVSMTAVATDGSALSHAWRQNLAAGETKRFTLTLPPLMNCAAGAEGDVIALFDKVLVPVSLGPRTTLLADSDLGASVFISRPAGLGVDTYTPTAGAVVHSSGTVSGGGAERVLQATAVLSQPAAGGNHAPQAQPDSIVAVSGSVSIAKTALLTNDIDADGHSLSVGAVGRSPLTRGTLTATTDSIRFVPESGFQGTTEFVYMVADGHGGVGAASVRVRVSGTTDVEDVSDVHGLRIMSVTPNPASRMVEVNFSIPRQMNAVIELVDVAGRRIARRELRLLAAGDHHATLMLRDADTGIYFIRLIAAERSITWKVSVVR